MCVACSRASQQLPQPLQPRLSTHSASLRRRRPQVVRAVSVVSFVMDCAHPHDISTIIDQTGVAIRAGHHCAQPLIDRFDIPSAARASFGMYNTVEEADRLVAGLEKVKEIFAR